MREAAGDDGVPGDDVAGRHVVEEVARRGQVPADAPERGEERVPGDDVATGHGVEHPARRGQVASAGEGGDALVVADEEARGDDGRSTRWVHWEFGTACVGVGRRASMELVWESKVSFPQIHKDCI